MQMAMAKWPRLCGYPSFVGCCYTAEALGVLNKLKINYGVDR